MSHWSICCCGEDPGFYLVPCLESPTCSVTYVATKAEWNLILGEDPVLDDVWKYIDPSEEDPCDFCGKFATQGTGAISPLSNSNFEKQDDCTDTDCPLPFMYFVPCEISCPDGEVGSEQESTTCGSYTMAARIPEWESFLNLPVGSIDPDIPSTYGGTWLFQRTDGSSCCEPGEERPFVSCFDFCGTLQLYASSGNLCFDTDPSDPTPALPSCPKCDVALNQIQILRSDSGVKFSPISGGTIGDETTETLNNCDQPDCPSCCETQPSLVVGTQYLKVRGRKIVDTLATINAEVLWEQITNGCNYRAEGECSSKIDYAIQINYTYYLEINANTWDGVDPREEWRRVRSGHCKTSCAVIDDMEFISNSLTSTSSLTWEPYDNDPECDPYPPAYSQSWNYAGSLAFGETTGASGSVSTPVAFAKIEKRQGLYVHGLYPECDWTSLENHPFYDAADSAFFPQEQIQLCSDFIDSDQCIVNWQNTGRLVFDVAGSGSCTTNFPGAIGGSWTPLDTEHSFYRMISTGKMSLLGKDYCCPDDPPDLDVMYWTDWAQAKTDLLQIGSLMTPPGITGDFDQGVLGANQFTLAICPTGGGIGSLRDIFSSQHCHGYGRTNTSFRMTPDSDEIGKCEGSDWDLDINLTSSLPATQAILWGGFQSRSLSIKLNASDVVLSVECVDSIPNPCDDGAFDPP